LFIYYLSSTKTLNIPDENHPIVKALKERICNIKNVSTRQMYTNLFKLAVSNGKITLFNKLNAIEDMESI